MKNHYNFCTLFDHNYLYKGIALYNSLQTNCPSFLIWILTMSDRAYDVLTKLNLKNARLIRLEDFEDQELKKLKQSRSQVEYMWTLTPSLPLYVLHKEPSLNMITYIDADCFFFSNPRPLFKEMGTDSVLIIEHRYASERKDWEKTSGRFNVEMLIFRRDNIGLKVLRRWRMQCNDWCYYRVEDGKLGDQMYLNTWPDEYEKIHILQHKGGGLAPWNVKNYKIHTIKNITFVDDDPLIFYHFHALRHYSPSRANLSEGYDFSANEKRLIYKPYLESLKKSIKMVEKVDSSFNYGFAEKPTIFHRLLSQGVILKNRVCKKK